MDSGWLVAGVAVAMVVGLVGTVLPIVPGLLLVWVAALVYGIVAGFGAVGWVCFGIVTALAVAGTVLGYVVPARASGAAGAARSSMVIGAVVGVVGFFVVPVVGLPLGYVVGLYLAERNRTRDAVAAKQATIATLKGYGKATALQLGTGALMVATWVGWVVAG